MPEYLAPGVYINENVELPQSITSAATNITVFIGYTERYEFDAQSLLNTPMRITSMLEFEDYFGGDNQHQFDIKPAKRGQIVDVSLATKRFCLSQSSHNFLLYRSLQLFFYNGGGECYVVSVGDYRDTINATSILAGLVAISAEVNASVIAIPDAVALDNAQERALVQQTLLFQCSHGTYKRFAILDIFQGYKDTSGVIQNDCVDEFRTNIGTANLSYAAAYYPWLESTVIKSKDLGFSLYNNITRLKQLLSLELTQSYPKPNRRILIKRKKLQSLIDSIAEGGLANLNQLQRNEQQQLHQSLLSLSSFYAAMIIRISEKLNLLPPSGAICASYAVVNNNYGVWKTPANISLLSVTRPCQKLSNEQQQTLNVHPSGKSINAIRSFIGKGVMIWGARTLAGNDNEWRYINVKRTVMMIEQSVHNGLNTLVFEPNDANLWSKTKMMIENFLWPLWQKGALIGAKTEEAYFVKVGLHQSMTSTDISEGRLIVQLGISMLRPAEFIVLKIEQKLLSA